MIEYGRMLKVSKSKYKIRFILWAELFQFLYINVLNSRYFYTYCVTFYKNKKNVGKINQIFPETMFKLSDGEEITTLAFFVLIQYRSVTDDQTDGRTDGHFSSGYTSGLHMLTRW